MNTIHTEKYPGSRGAPINDQFVHAWVHVYMCCMYSCMFYCANMNWIGVFGSYDLGIVFMCWCSVWAGWAICRIKGFVILEVATSVPKCYLVLALDRQDCKKDVKRTSTQGQGQCYLPGYGVFFKR